MSKTIYVEVAIQIANDADPYDTIQECDYQFSGEGILSHEIVSVVDSDDRSVFWTSCTNIMLFKVTQIEFDFTTDNDEDSLNLEEQIDLLDEVKDGVWEAEDEEDLVEKITSIYGWCINSINFETFFLNKRIEPMKHKTFTVTLSAKAAHCLEQLAENEYRTPERMIHILMYEGLQGYQYVHELCARKLEEDKDPAVKSPHQHYTNEEIVEALKPMAYW